MTLRTASASPSSGRWHRAALPRARSPDQAHPPPPGLRDVPGEPSEQPPGLGRRCHDDLDDPQDDEPAAEPARPQKPDHSILSLDVDAETCAPPDADSEALVDTPPLQALDWWDSVPWQHRLDLDVVTTPLVPRGVTHAVAEVKGARGPRHRITILPDLLCSCLCRASAVLVPCLFQPFLPPLVRQ